MEAEHCDRALAWLDLRRDAVFNKIPIARRRYYLEHALAAGENAAANLPHRDLERLYAENDISIKLATHGGVFFSARLRAQLEYSKAQRRRQVTLYLPSLDSLRASCAQMGYTMSEREIIHIHLAHEFFHFLEYHHHQPVPATLDKVCHFAFGPWRSYATVMATSEIAAHRFCQRLNGLPFYPSWFDWLWLIDNGKCTAQQRDAMLASARKELQQI